MTPRVNDRYFIGAGLLLLLTSAGAMHYAALRAAVATSALPAIGKALGAEANRPLVVVAFRSHDCGSAIEGLQQLNRFESLGLATVRGVLLDASRLREPINELLDGSGIDFVVRGDSADTMKRLVEEAGYSQTPILLVFDRHGGLRVVRPLPLSATTWPEAVIEEAIRHADEPSAALVSSGKGESGT